MIFEYDKRKFTGTYNGIIKQLKSHLRKTGLWLINDKFQLCEEKCQRHAPAVGIDMIQNILIRKALAKVLKPSEYFDENAEIQFNDGLLQIHLDNVIIGCRGNVLSYIYILNLREDWIRQNA